MNMKKRAGNGKPSVGLEAMADKAEAKRFDVNAHLEAAKPLGVKLQEQGAAIGGLIQKATAAIDALKVLQRAFLWHPPEAETPGGYVFVALREADADLAIGQSCAFLSYRGPWTMAQQVLRLATGDRIWKDTEGRQIHVVGWLDPALLGTEPIEISI